MRPLLGAVALPVTLSAAIAAAILLDARGVPSSSLMLPLFLVCVLLAALLERVIPHRTAWNRPRGDVWTDAAYVPTSWAVGGLAQPLASVLAVWLGTAAAGLLGPGPWPAHWPILAQLPLAWALVELVDYWAHRALHQVPLLWRLHAVHHSAQRLYWLNTTRSHPLEMLGRGVGNLIPLALLGAPELLIALSGITNLVVGLFQHANVDLRLGPLNHVFSALPVHRWHHSRERAEADSNYGNSFIFWDHVFGTFLLPRDHEVDELGIEGLDAYPRGYLAQLVAPLHWNEILARSAGAGCDPVRAASRSTTSPEVSP